MNNLKQQLEQAEPYDEWYKDILLEFQEEAAEKGVDIPNENRRNEPAISFSGFWSQGDGLAFDASINWEKFLATNKEFQFQDELPKWYMFLTANPSSVPAACHRNNARGYAMVAYVDDYIHEHHTTGFFAGVSDDELHTILDFSKLETFMQVYFEDMADDFYNRLEKEYEGQMECENERIIEDYIEENQAEIREVLAAFLLHGESFGPAACTETLIDKTITLSELHEVGFVDYHSWSEKIYKVSDKGKEFVCQNSTTD